MTDLAGRLSSLSPAKRALLERMRASGAAQTPIPAIFEGPAPLSSEQRRLWYLLQMAPGYPIYTIPVGFRVRGPLDAPLLERCLRVLVQRHETLRTRFRESSGNPVQEVGDGGAFRLERVDVADDEWRQEEADYQCSAFARRTFSLATGDVFHALLLREGPDDHRLLLGFHHLVADGGAVALLLRELSALYAAGGSDAGLTPLPLRFRDWAAWQQRGEATATATADEDFWRAQLRGAPTVLELPLDGQRAPLQGWQGAKHTFRVPAEVTAGMRALARQCGTTLYAVAAAALGLLLGRYSGDGELLLGTVLANRPRPELEALVGFFANTLPLRIGLGGNPTVEALVARVHHAALGLQAHAGIPFDRLLELTRLRRDPSRPPLVQALLVLTDSPGAALALPGIEIEPLALDSQTSIFELSVLLEDEGSTLSGSIQYPGELFTAPSIARLSQHLVTLLQRFADHPAAPIDTLQLGADDELATVAQLYHQAPPPPLDAETLHALFERQARATPDAPALLHRGEVVSYAELNARANRIAHALIARGLGPEQRVGVCMRRTPELVATLLGVLKSGAAYIPLDPAHPVARLRRVLELARPGLVVADSLAAPVSAALPAGVPLADGLTLDSERAGDPSPRGGRDHLAYVIFTSGSTGGPKGVEIEHRCTLRMLRWVRDQLNEDERRSVLASTPLTFDPSLVELFGVLGWGGTAVLVENALAPLPAGVEVYTAAMTPTAAGELLREGRMPPSLTTLLLGGEAVPPRLATELFSLPRIQRVLNLYGPTEDTTYSTCAELRPLLERVPIGRPIDGGRVYVLDAQLRHAGIGVPGELWTAGEGVTRGYASRPGLTAERFLPDPFGPTGSRMYRTFDRGRLREDGQLEYLGRADAQVKVRGHRIELEEVEQALAAHPAVARCAAAVRVDAGGERQLVGYTVPEPGSEPPPASELRAFVRERLPEFMVPTAFVTLDELPLTSSEKLDRRALPDPDAPAPCDPVAPRTPLEAQLVEVWREVLGLERLGVHDDFFDLGGQSILATRLVAQLRERLGLELGVAELLQAPTVEALARLAEGARDALRKPLVALQRFGTRPPLFLCHPAGGHVVCYRALGIFLAPEQPVYALHPQGADDGLEPLSTIPGLAAYYVEAIRRFQPDGPYRVAGWSFGGVVVWEMAQQLTAAGAEVELLALFDTQPHLPEVLKLNPREEADVVWHTVAGLAGHGAAGRVDVETLRGLEPREMVTAMVRGIQLPQLLGESRVDDVLALTRVRAANLRAQHDYRPVPYPGHLTYFSTGDGDRENSGSRGLAFWQALALGGTTEHPVGGTHGTILSEPYVHTLVEAILAEGWKAG